MKPCPACDVQHSDDPLFCLALGVAVGHSYAEMHHVTEQMCATHRKPYIMAMINVAHTMRSLETADRALLSEGTDSEGK